MSESEVDRAFEVVSTQLAIGEVEFLMIGGHAVNHYGITRATHDIDFMIATADAPTVRTLMREGGFTNIAIHDVVTFFRRPGSPLRIDFLEVDPQTMTSLLANAAIVPYMGGQVVKVPCLRDLIAMKLFALSSGDPKRWDKDFPDIVHLAIEHDWDLDTDLRPLCQQFGSEAIYEDLHQRIRELRDA